MLDSIPLIAITGQVSLGVFAARSSDFFFLFPFSVSSFVPEGMLAERRRCMYGDICPSVDQLLDSIRMTDAVKFFLASFVVHMY